MKVARATGLMGGLTVSSRILGLFRDVAQAAILGTSAAADAFTLAFIVPNTLRRLFGEATVSAAFVPTYTESLMKESREEAFRLAGRILTMVGSLLLVIVLLGMAFSPFIVRLFAPGFSEVAGKSELTAGLLRLLFPYILMVGCASIVMGILNAHRHFLAPATAPILFNISAIAGILLLSKVLVPGQPVWGYSVGVMAGGVFQLLVQIPALRKRGFRFRPDFNWRDPRVRKVLMLAFPALIGLLAAEVNIIVDKMIASALEPGSVSALAYGNRIMQFPQGVFAVSLATALLPTLSRQTAAGKLKDAGKTLDRATMALAILLIPATLCIIFLAEPIVRVLLARGAFSSESVSLTSAALIYYSAGLLFYGGVKITAPVFYAMKDTRTPVRIAVGCMALNIVLNIVLTIGFIKTGMARPLAGLALATSISSALNLFLLRRALAARLGPLRRSSMRPWLSMLPSTLLTGGLLHLLAPLAERLSGASFIMGLLGLIGVSLASMAAFLSIFALTGGQEARSIFSLATRRGRIGKS